MSMPATRHRFTLEDWYQMLDAGVLRDDQRLELLDGEIFEMTPIDPPHASIVDRLTRFWVTRLGTRAIVRVQGPVPTDPRSEPQPDLAILRERADFYGQAHPTTSDVHLVIEVADSSLAYDHAKLRFYARARIPEVWIVDIQGDQLEVYRTPEGPRYTDVRMLSRGEIAASLAFPDVEVAVGGVLG